MSYRAWRRVLRQRYLRVNITRLFDFLQAHPKRFSIEAVELANIPGFVDISHLNKATVDTADVFKPVLLAEISPGRYNLIDGQHRVARARRENLVQIAAYRVSCPDHVAFLTSAKAYESYVRYWNSKQSDKV
jgi:hypothetical protein